MNSVSTSYSDFAATLKTPDWFSVKLFPKAIFDSNQITKTGEHQYQAAGTLTIRDKTMPVILDFKTEELSKSKLRVIGKTTLKRTDFGIGKGEWGDTDTVKDDVKVDFTLSLEKSS
jgi:polyisoprenoid-binding protein YceI